MTRAEPMQALQISGRSTSAKAEAEAEARLCCGRSVTDIDVVQCGQRQSGGFIAAARALQSGRSQRMKSMGARATGERLQRMRASELWAGESFRNRAPVQPRPARPECQDALAQRLSVRRHAPGAERAATSKSRPRRRSIFRGVG